MTDEAHFGNPRAVAVDRRGLLGAVGRPDVPNPYPPTDALRHKDHGQIEGEMPKVIDFGRQVFQIS